MRRKYLAAGALGLAAVCFAGSTAAGAVTPASYHSTSTSLAAKATHQQAVQAGVSGAALHAFATSVQAATGPYANAPVPSMRHHCGTEMMRDI